MPLPQVKLTKSENEIYVIMRTFGTNYDTIMEHTTRKRSTVRRIMAQLIKKGLVVRGMEPVTFRVVVEDKIQ